MFHKQILGNPTQTQLQDYSYTEKAVKYYIQHGLKFTHRFSVDSYSEWGNLSIENGKVKFENCITY